MGVEARYLMEEEERRNQIVVVRFGMDVELAMLVGRRQNIVVV